MIRTKNMRLGALYRVFFCVLKVDQGDGVPSSFCKGLNIEEDRGNTYTINSKRYYIFLFVHMITS